MISRVVYRKQPGRRVATVLAAAGLIVGTIGIAATAVASPPEGSGLFELDKNASNDVTTTHVGTLKGNINASTTTIDVCELVGAPAADSALLIDGEQMTFKSAGTTSTKTGGCSFTDPALVALDVRTYTVVRGASATAHPGGSDITQLGGGAPAGADWDIVYTAHQANASADNPCSGIPGAVACDWIDDTPGTSMFTQGSADILDMPDEHWTDSSVPDADEILHAYAIKFGETQQYLYFGADRYAVNGAKDMGFWFFKNSVVAAPNGTFVDDEGNPATHAVGDILLLGTFTQGGAITAIRIYSWVGSDGSDGSLNGEGNFGDCVPGGSSSGCNTVNNTTIVSPWAYVGKGAVASDVIYGGGFMEGGVDLNALGLQGCFASFMAETRSSPSLTAAQKDFALGKFESCGSGLETTPKLGNGSALSADSNANNLVETSIGTGTVSVEDSALLEVTGTASFTGTLSFNVCGPLASGTCSTGGVAAGSIPVTGNGTYLSDPVTLTSIGRYCWRADFDSTTKGVPDATDSSGESAGPPSSTGECFEVLPVEPTLITTAWTTGDSEGSVLTDPVPFGTALYDKATLSGTATEPGTDGGTTPGQAGSQYPTINATNGAAADGTITFTLKGPDTVDKDGKVTNCSTANAGKLDGTTGTNPQTGGTVSGNGDNFSSGFTPSSPGQFHWVAAYSGSTSGNTKATTHNTGCGNSAEAVVVQQLQPTMSTAQRFVPNDSATVSVGGGAGALNGHVVFKLYVNDATCSSEPAYTSTSLAVAAPDTGKGNTLKATVSSANTTAYDTTGTTFSWVVVFTSDNPAHLGVTSPCGTETSSISIANEAPTP